VIPAEDSHFEEFRKSNLIDENGRPNPDSEFGFKSTIKKFVKGSVFKLIFDFYTGRVPKMFRLYHSPEDKSEHLSEKTLKMVSEVLVDAVLKLGREA